MQRRHLIALAPVLALGACSSVGGDGSASDGGSATAAGTPPGSDGAGSDDGGATSTGDGASDGSTTTDPTTAPPTLAEQRLSALSAREIAGQLVLVGIQQGSTISPELVEEHHAGGFFLLGNWKDAAEVEALTAAAQDLSPADCGALFAVDQEGGQVRRLRGDAGHRTASAEELGAEGVDAVREAYKTIGEDLAALGLPLALAPVADVVDPDLGDANEPVGGLDRGFGTDPEHVGACVAAAIEGLASAGVGGTLKHFPGLGRVEQNTDFSAEGIVDDVTDAEDPFLASFVAGMDAGADAVMLSSAVYPRIEADVPAMFSPAVVTDLLRDRLGWDGLVVSDDIGIAEAVQSIPVAERATRLLAAGGDVLLTADPSLTGALVDAIQAWAAESEEQGARVRASAARMLAVKERRGLLDG
ncbi:glycoside hydrolase family 3 N-terminal domain-containing protein [Brachybacterium sp. DNPG3]